MRALPLAILATIAGCGGTTSTVEGGKPYPGISSGNSLDAGKASVDPMAVDGSSVDEPSPEGATAPTSGGGEASDAVTGIVVSSSTLRPLAGQTVVIDGRKTTTDDGGRFALSAVGSSYDAMVVGPGGTSISIFQHLQRRDPVLPHPGESSPNHVALVSGDISGGGNYPLVGTDLVVVEFLSPEASEPWPLGGSLSTAQQGPGFGPMQLRWEGPANLSGELVALGTFRQTDGSRSSWFVDQPLTLADGRTAFADLALTHVAHTGHITGPITAPTDGSILQKSIFYRPPRAGGSMFIPATQSDAFDDDVPDLTQTGWDLCIAATASPGSSYTERCGLSVDQKDVGLTLQSPPTFVSPLPDATIARDAPFAWTGFENGVYLLQLEVTPSSEPTPRIYLFTSDTGTLVPDLAALDVGVPAGTGYRCTIAGLGPYVSMDEALGPGGLAAARPAEIRRSFSPPINVTVGP